MIDTANEELLPLSAAARQLPGRDGRRGIHVSTVWRWSLRGVRSVRLETALIGGVRMTSREALARFFARTTAAANGTTPMTRTSRQREAAIRRAEAELAETA